LLHRNNDSIQQQQINRHLGHLADTDPNRAVVEFLGSLAHRLAAPESLEVVSIAGLNGGKGLAAGSVVLGQLSRDFNGIIFSCYQGGGVLNLSAWGSLLTGVNQSVFDQGQYFFTPTPVPQYVPLPTQYSIPRVTIISDPSQTSTLIGTIAFCRF
jgi:hypothetical protein